MSFSFILKALSVVRPLALMGVLFSQAVLLAYALNVQVLYRPLSDGPGTHPFTAIQFAALGLAVLFWRPRKKRQLPLSLGLLGILIALIRLFEMGFSVPLLAYVTPFSAVLEGFSASGQPISMGANTAMTGLLIGIAFVAAEFKHYIFAQRLAYTALMIPTVGLVGFSYGIGKFYGQMALSTMVISMPIAVSVLLSTSHHGLLRTILSPWMPGKLARIQILLGSFVPFIIGYLLLRLTTEKAADIMGLFVVSITLFIVMLVLFSAESHEKLDRRRRSIERNLAIAARYDVLTELPNRGYLLDQGQWLLARSNRAPEMLSVLILDIDHFKHINDTYGHPVGDEVLKRLAGEVRSALRKQDILGRYGGEEFVALLPETPLTGAVQVADKVRQKVALASFPYGERVTLSIGCAEVEGDESLEALLARADAGLYRAKQGGRNRVEPSFVDALCLRSAAGG